MLIYFIWHKQTNTEIFSLFAVLKVYLLIIFLSFLGFCSASLFGKLIGFVGASYLTTCCLVFSLFFSLLAFYEVVFSNCVVYIKLTSWISSEALSISWGFVFDTLTVVMCVVVTFVSCLVHLYSTEYMAHDPHLTRFMSYLSLFTFFMLILVTSDNFIQLFIGWEGVGLCSYLLINFWFTRIQANKAAIKAMLLNRIGDFSLIIAIMLIYTHFKSLDFATVSSLTPFLKLKTINFLNFNFSLVTSCCLFLFIGAVGKSAQLGLHTWLPDAMEGPTPVSALIHAATMVTAGVFLIARSFFLYEQSAYALSVVLIVGALTSFFASSVGIVQNDLKRVVAYSTCSQLGYMIFACGLSNYSVSVFHLTNHAFFKALLFLCAGSVIHSINDEQDMRKMGGLRNLIPFTYSMMLIGSLALIGFPFLSGFYSKDLILEVAYSKYSILGYFSYTLGTLGAFFTAFYSTRLVYLTFLSKPMGHKQTTCFASESNTPIVFSLVLLAIPSMFAGYYLKDLLVGIGSPVFNTNVSVLNLNIFDAEFLPSFYKIFPVFLSLQGVFFALLLFFFNSNFLFSIKTSFFGKKVYVFLNRKWFFDKVYNECFGQFFFKFGYSVSYKFVDRGIFEILGPTGISTLVLNIGSYFHAMHSGHLYHYMLIILVTITILLGFYELENLFNFLTTSNFKIIVLLLIFIFYFSNYVSLHVTNKKFI